MSSNIREKPSVDTGAAARQRVQLDFTTEAYAQLQDIKAKAHAKTNAEVVRNAIRLYDWFLQQKQEDYRFLLEKGDKVKEVELIF